MKKMLEIDKYLHTLQTINPIKINGKVTQSSDLPLNHKALTSRWARFVKSILLRMGPH